MTQHRTECTPAARAAERLGEALLLGEQRLDDGVSELMEDLLQPSGADVDTVLVNTQTGGCRRNRS
jgi:hypothetical protein